MLRNGIIRPSHSPMAIPLVYVLKVKEGRDGVCLAVDYRSVNGFTHGDAYVLPDLTSIFQHAGRSRYITLMYRTVYGHCGLKFASFLHCWIILLVGIVLIYRNSTVVSIVMHLVLLIAAHTLGIVLIMMFHAHRLFRLLKDD